MINWQMTVKSPRDMLHYRSTYVAARRDTDIVNRTPQEHRRNFRESWAAKPDTSMVLKKKMFRQ